MMPKTGPPGLAKRDTSRLPGYGRLLWRVLSAILSHLQKIVSIFGCWFPIENKADGTWATQGWRVTEQAALWAQVVFLAGGALGHGLAAPEEDSLSTGEPQIRDNLQVCHNLWCQCHHPQKLPGKPGDPIVYSTVCSIPGCWFLQGTGTWYVPCPYLPLSLGPWGLFPWT